MTEEDWLTGSTADAMLNFVMPGSSDRKVLLFACSCLWRCWDLLVDERSRDAVVAVEWFAEGLIGSHELQEFHDLASNATDAAIDNANAERLPRNQHAQLRAALAVNWAAMADAAESSSNAARAISIAKGQDFHSACIECGEQAELLRHHFGNPFRPYAAPGHWPNSVSELAQSLYDGQGNRFILADALEDSGHLDLAAHFRQEECHPKGCWIMDLVLGKK